MSQPVPETPEFSFQDLKLAAPLVQVLDEIGYETPTPIQRQAIPVLLEGGDLLGHAPTGTGKTAAFALPLLSRIDFSSSAIQVLVLTPTRELAIQVAEAFQRYASRMKGFHVLPIYGGQQYGSQIRQLNRGVQVVVGTPGRLMDHMRKGTLKLDGLRALVLDEADEMLRMGFLEEVEWILEQTPDDRQIALFSATMPKQVERIARRYLNAPREISIKARTATAETIRQRYWPVSGVHKLEALTRMLEVERFDAILLFVRTKLATTELAEKLEARGFAAAAMNGDMPQNQREQTVERLKRGSLNILVATDVAARGLDVDRISHVINYDMPYDTEAYIHRIGRTGRAGRKGEAILFVAPRERRMLSAIERATRQKIEPMTLPSTETVNNQRIANFKQQITDTLAAGELAFMQGLIEQYRNEHDVPALEIAAALAKLTIGDKALLLSDEKPKRKKQDQVPFARSPELGDLEEDSERFRIEVGRDHGVKPGNIVGAIANEAGIDGEHIGRIVLDSDHSYVDLPAGMPKEIFIALKKVVVCGRQLRITRFSEPPETEAADRGGERRPRRVPVRRQLEPGSGADQRGGSGSDPAESTGRPRGEARSRASGKGSRKDADGPRSRKAGAEAGTKGGKKGGKKGDRKTGKGSDRKSGKKRASNAATAASRTKG